MPSGLSGLVWWRCLAIVVLGVALVAGSVASARAQSPLLNRVETQQAWFAGGPPSARIGVTGEFFDKRTKAYYYKAKAVVTRSPGDVNGSMVFLRARNWRAAFDEFDRRSVPKSGLPRGFLRDTIIKTGGYSAAELNERFPPLTARFAYVIEVIVDEETLRLNDSRARRSKGKRRFVEPLSVGLPPGTHRIAVLSCLWPDESHPMSRPFALAIRGADFARTAFKIGSAAVGWLSGGPVGAFAGTVAGQFVEELGKSFVVNMGTCSSAVYSLEVLAKVPPLRNLDVDDATDQLEQRRLKIDVDHQFVRRTSCANVKDVVTGQRPRAGRRLQKGGTVYVSVRFCQESGRPVPVGSWTGTWSGDYGPIVLIQTGNRVKGCYKRENSTITGTVRGKVLDGDWTNREGGGDKTGPLLFTLKGKTFSGGWAYDGEVGPGNSNPWSATRVSMKTDTTGICDLP